MREIAAAFVISAFAITAPASSARAYLDTARFEAPAIEGGGGGRSFTGAPADGYTCAVCHRGGGSPALDVAGIPEDGWEPGATYELVVTLPAATRNAGAALEIAGDDGRGRGAIAIVPDAELEAGDRCRDGVTATTLALDAGERLVARTNVCGAARARVRWTAPPTAESGVRLFVSAVAGNDSADPSGDGASAVVLPLRARGAPEAEGAMLGQRCSTTQGAGSTGVAATTLALAALVLGWRARRRRRDRGA